MDGQSRSSLMESMIEESDARCRLVHVGAVSSCAPFDVREPSVRVRPVWVVPLHSMPVHHRQCEGLPTVTRDESRPTEDTRTCSDGTRG